MDKKKQWRVFREIRTCAAPDCNVTFECMVTSKKRFCSGGHSRKGKVYRELVVCARLDCENTIKGYGGKFCCRSCAGMFNASRKEIREKRKETVERTGIQKIAQNRPEVKVKKSVSMKKRYEDLDEREKTSIAQKKYYREHPEAREKMRVLNLGKRGKESRGWKGGLSYFSMNGQLKHRDIIYNELFEKQNGVCAICGKSETKKSSCNKGRVKHKNICNLSIDHDHKTGEVRGLLCGRCNGILGHSKDNEEFLLRAVRYLEKSRENFENMVCLLPQLPCKNRYTEDWISVWSRELRNLDVRFKVLGDKKPVVITKYFTDPLRALAYESEQISVLARANPSKVFCLDIGFPGLLTSAIQVLRLMNSGLKVGGYLHAGSWCAGDIFSRTLGRKYIERSIFDTFDKVFVASNYHKNKIEECFEEKFDNIEVVGFPFYRKDVEAYVKPLPFEEKKGILINGRVEQSNMEIVDVLRKRFSDQKIQFVDAKNRREYYEQLNKAKVVLSLKTEETFGIGQLEAYVLGGIPLCPNKFAYPEVFSDERLLYSSENDLVDKLACLLELDHDPWSCLCLQYPDIDQYEQTIAKCVEGLV